MRARGHLIVGALAGAAVNVAWQLAAIEADPTRKFDGWQLLGSVAVGGGAAMAPDLFEPALHSHHRQFFHSVTAGVILSWLLCGKHIGPLTPATRMLLGCATVGYLSHLAADALTTRSIRII